MKKDPRNTSKRQMEPFRFYRLIQIHISTGVLAHDHPPPGSPAPTGRDDRPGEIGSPSRGSRPVPSRYPRPHRFEPGTDLHAVVPTCPRALPCRRAAPALQRRPRTAGRDLASSRRSLPRPVTTSTIWAVGTRSVSPVQHAHTPDPGFPRDRFPSTPLPPIP